MKMSDAPVRPWYYFRKRVLLYPFVPLLIVGACEIPVVMHHAWRQTTMSMPEFRKLPPFRGRVFAVEEIPPHGLHARSLLGPDYRVVIEKPDGKRIVVRPVHTGGEGAIEMPKLTGQDCDLPKAIADLEAAGARDDYRD